MHSKVSIHHNAYGAWRIERIGVRGAYRWQLWWWSNAHGKWALVANQGRRKTCVELAYANYKGGFEE